MGSIGLGSTGGGINLSWDHLGWDVFGGINWQWDVLVVGSICPGMFWVGSIGHGINWTGMFWVSSLYIYIYIYTYIYIYI